jgi:TatD DNase family protein
LATAREEREPSSSRACFRRLGFGEILIAPSAPLDPAYARVVSSGRDDQTSPALERLRQADAGVEEALTVFVPALDLKAGLCALREDDKTAVSIGGLHQDRLTLSDRLAVDASPGYPAARAPMLHLADAHCHLDPHHFAEGPDAVMARARAAGVVGFVVVGLARVDREVVGDPIEPARFAVDLARRLPGQVAACVGLHPHDAADHDASLHERLKELAREPDVAAVGEIGLDYHYDHSPRDRQREVFAALIALAREVKKPIVVHTRSAPDDTLDILEREGAREAGGIIHCFSEDRAFAARALDLGFDLSFSGIVTFKNAQAVRDVAGWAPLDRILVETDSPFLAPVPLRGKKCEPALVVHTARQVADLRAMAPEALAEATLRNTERRFGKVFG